MESRFADIARFRQESCAKTASALRRIGNIGSINHGVTGNSRATIFWDTDRILGRAWEIDPRTVMLTWTRKGEPQTYLYEMIQISADGQDRGRTWHWFENDVLVKRTCIKEKREK
jgi:hypothetical protein